MYRTKIRQQRMNITRKQLLKKKRFSLQINKRQTEIMLRQCYIWNSQTLFSMSKCIYFGDRIPYIHGQKYLVQLQQS